ncbi:MAG: ABC transporter ATP-binding protein, partial [Clostridia bacterium]|nr:ABC transporter ATP-binding protein [Clostridia bacterium]
HVKCKIMEKAKALDLSAFDLPSFYEKLENANREAGMRPISILSATFRVISSLISTVSFIVILAGLHPLAPVIIVVMSLPGALVNYRFRNKNFNYVRWHSKERRQMYYFSSVVSDKDKAKEVRIMGLSDTLIGKYKEAFAKYFKGLRKIIVKEQVVQTAVGLFSLVANCLIFMYVAYRVIYHDGLIGDYSLYTGALSSILSYVGTVIASTATIYEGTLFIDNMIVFMEEDIKVIPSIQPPLVPKKNAKHTIEFRNVSFRYPGTDKDVIKNVSLTISSGDTVLLVGLNGAGKTTLIKLLTRLYDVTEGEILLDGINIRSYDLKELYSLYGIIFQDYVKYAVSVKENIAFGDVSQGIDEEKVIAAAKKSDADGFICKLPDGYETPLMRIFEQNGIELSIGQWQKLSIARAFYKDCDIMILDEPTASLDPLAEQEIFNQFSELSDGKLTLLVSHRLSSATRATKILVMENGELIEEGTHDALMKKNGRYALLFRTQAKHYVDNIN